MKNSIITLVLTLTFFCCQSQKKNSNAPVGGPCEGCEAVFEYGKRALKAIDTLPGFHQNEPKLKITGTVFKKDGREPAENVILYIYHTNRKGIYETRGDETGWGRRHGYIRGWIKTGKDGRYTFYTFRPASYPDRSEPEHIHIYIKEPGKNEYYIDDILFDDDPLLTASERSKRPNRGGSGIIRPQPGGGLFVIDRDITLGLNIPHYD